MRRTKTKRLIFRCAGIVGLAGLAWLGSHAGHYMARAGWFQGDAAAAGKSSRGLSSVPERAASAPVKSEEVASALRRLRAIASASPNLMADFEAEAQVDAILAKLSAGELAAIFAELDATLARGDFNNRVLLQKTGLAWVVLDPTAAMTAAVAKSKNFGQYYTSSMFGEWAADAPEAAFAWLNSAELPAALTEIKDELRRSALMYLAERDFDLATAEFLKMGGKRNAWSDPRGGILADWASLYLDEPGMRERLVEFAKSTGRPEDYASLNDALLRQWPQEDPLGMLEYLQGLKDYLESDAVPAEKRAEADATAVSAAIYREYTRPALEWWMERYSQSTETPQPMRQAMQYWVHQRPGELQQWFAEQPESPQRDALNAAAATYFTVNSKYLEATQRVEQIRDPKIRQTAVERLSFVWSAKDAQAAAAWRATQ